VSPHLLRIPWIDGLTMLKCAQLAQQHLSHSSSSPHLLIRLLDFFCHPNQGLAVGVLQTLELCTIITMQYSEETDYNGPGEG
jgi:hypothetical protein